MATAALQGFSFAGDQCTASVLYDDQTLSVTGISYQNLTAADAAVEVDPAHGQPKTFTLAAGTAPAVLDVTSSKYTLTSRQAADKQGNPVTIIEWPAGWSIQARWPA